MEHGTILPPTGYDPHPRDGSDVSRRLFLKGIGITCLGFVPFLQACDNAFSRGGTENGTARTGSVPRAIRPPIDVAARAETRTATFSLG